ncbi:MAG: hypothetical protein JNK87_02870 [Bryobacterales bacterium]|nr:hypothetical protein [Bryobacterales bacterium]
MFQRSFLLAVILLALNIVPALAQDDAEGIHWLTSYREAREEAKKTGKPIFLEFRCEA